MTSILKTIKKLETVSDKPAKVAMTEEQIIRCKARVRADKRGYNVTANQYDLAVPFRVSINYSGEWKNFGNFVSVDVAAAVGTIVSLGYFGSEKAKAGLYDAKIVEASDEFTTWMENPLNAEIIARAKGELPTVHDEAAKASAKAAVNDNLDDDIPF